MVERGINAPLTSSCGRLFDAVAAIAGLRNQVNYEGQAALELEQTIPPGDREAAYPVELRSEGDQWIFDPATTIRAIVDDVQQGTAIGAISARFHRALAEVVGQTVERIRDQQGLNRVAFSGGVFQNRYLTEAAVERVKAAGFDVLLHSEIPPNDGGLALGQAVIAGWKLRH